MRALTFDGQQPTLQANCPDLTPKPGEVVVRPTRMGVCATDIELCKGYMNYTGVLGHEFVGIVEQVGDSADKSWIDQRVVASINCVCGTCDMCKAGLREHCRNRTVLGIAGRDGCFADQFVIPTANLFAVPDHVDDDHAVFTEPLAAAFQILRQLSIEGRPYITILGDGPLGLLCAQVVSKLNATVRCIGKHPEKLELCEKWAIKHRLLNDVGLRQDQDIVIDATGSPTGLETAMQMVRPRGTIVLKTTFAPPGSFPPRDNLTSSTSSLKPQTSSLNLSPLVIHEINLIGSRCGPFPDALAALSSQSVDVVSLISRRMKLGDGPDILKAAAQPGILKVLVEP